ncbi:MAG TPA: 23S rRNA methyltransferase, partial [Ruminococcaceae bacterium]|nr:23S rRNA methyltransferase [Oscillospiraceae bacterium]
QRHNRKVVFAYLLLPGINDRSSDIRQLAKWFKGKNVMINVLQYNPTSNSKIRAPQKQEMVAFKHQLEQTGLEVTMRVSHGREIKAACGQLANTYNKAKKQQK